MWRPNPRNSQEITFRKITFDDEHSDEYNHPVQSHEDVKRTVELYPYSDAIKRQAMGIESELAYLIVTCELSISPQDVFIIDKVIFKIKSIAEHDPMQLIVESTGEVIE